MAESNGRVERTEYYDGGRKWETYDGGRLAIVAFDTLHRGTPDRRLVYAADGSTRMEFDQKRTSDELFHSYEGLRVGVSLTYGL
jgi:hypothetical protein